jgi:Uma2 family endonuclease
MPISDATYRRVALEDPEGHWELVCGRLREKPPMTTEHNETARALRDQFILRIDRARFTVADGDGRLRIASGTFYEPDLCIIPRAMVARLKEQPGTFEVYADPIPLVVEVWSPSTGDYDVDAKIPEYQRRGDLEIWRIHPYDRTLTAWRRQPDGTHTETLLSGGVIHPIAVPGVTIAIDRLFD